MSDKRDFETQEDDQKHKKRRTQLVQATARMVEEAKLAVKQSSALAETAISIAKKAAAHSQMLDAHLIALMRDGVAAAQSDEHLDPYDAEQMHQAELDAVNAAREQAPPPSSTSSGYPDDGSACNAKFEELLGTHVLKLRSGTNDKGTTDQIVDYGAHGQRNDIFENKELLKTVSPRFFFNATHKEWRRFAPDGWTPEP